MKNIENIFYNYVNEKNLFYPDKILFFFKEKVNTEHHYQKNETIFFSQKNV